MTDNLYPGTGKEEAEWSTAVIPDQVGDHDVATLALL